MNREPSVKTISSEWIRRYEIIEKFGDRAPEADATFSAFQAFHELARNEPQRALDAIVWTMESTQNEFVLENLAAGPLEVLLSKHGPTVIEQVEAQAKLSDKFKWLLDGVWLESIPTAIALRVERAVKGR